jgi:hypothetical protein
MDVFTRQRGELGSVDGKIEKRVMELRIERSIIFV